MIPYLEFYGPDTIVHFAHANGYPPQCYQPLLNKLAKDYSVLAMLQRPLWPGSSRDELKDWLPLSTDLIQFLDEHKIGPILAIGHSMGGTASLRAALREPHRFRALILFDPVIFPPYMVRSWQLIRALKLERRLNPFIRNTLRRRRIFDSREQLLEQYRHKHIFRYFNDESLLALVTGLTHWQNGKYELVYSPEWEAHIYVTAIWRDMDIWGSISSLQVPLLIIRGAETDTFQEYTGNLVQKRLPSVCILTLDRSTHLVPLERPDECYQAIHIFLKDHI